MKSTRQRLLDYLEVKGVATAAELSRALQVTQANIRHHLGILSAENLVQPVGAMKQRSRGRPAQLYCLAIQADADNLDRLAGALLEELMEGLPQEGQRILLRSVARRLSGIMKAGASQATSDGYAQDKLPLPHLSQRLYQAVQRLNELNYLARWEARAAAPHLVLGRCPYAAIIHQHPQLCQMDAYLLEELLGVPARQTAKLAKSARGTLFCSFAVEKDKLGVEGARGHES